MNYFYIIIFLTTNKLFSKSLDEILINWDKIHKRNASVLIYETKSSSIVFSYGSNLDLNKSYSIGSLMKPISALILLEEREVFLKNKYSNCNGKINYQNFSLYDRDSYNLDKNTLYCSNHLGHGKIDLQDAISYSCNTYFINKVKIDSDLFLIKLHDYLFLNIEKDNQSLSELDKIFVSIGESKKIRFYLKDILSIYDFIVSNESKMNYKVLDKNREIVFNSLKLTLQNGTLKDLQSNQKKINLLAGKTGTSTQIYNKKRTDAWILLYYEKENSLFTLLVHVPKAKAKKEGKEVLQLILDNL